MQNNCVRVYYDILSGKRSTLYLKKTFDVVASIISLVLLSPLFAIISLAIKISSRGPVFFRQIRVTQFGRHFKIYKFRTMVNHAEELGTLITTMNDSRITQVGKLLRKYRLDELPQLINILTGDMTFVGTRPEVVKYVQQYTDDMMATLLLPAGVTSEASIRGKDEAKLLDIAEIVDSAYLNKILPDKMFYNLNYLKKVGALIDLKILVRTVISVMSKNEISGTQRELDVITQKSAII